MNKAEKLLNYDKIEITRYSPKKSIESLPVNLKSEIKDNPYHNSKEY